MRNRFNRFSTRVLLTCDRGTITFHRFTFRHTAYTVSICLLRTLKSHFRHTVNTVSTCPLRMPFGTEASSMGLFRPASGIYLPLSARRRRPYVSVGTTASSTCLFRHDGIVYMPLSARPCRLYASLGTTASSLCPFRRRLWASFGTTASSILTF